jgi:hypothetical protein
MKMRFVSLIYVIQDSELGERERKRHKEKERKRKRKKEKRQT